MSANLSGCLLIGADFRGAFLGGADLRFCWMLDATFAGAHLAGCQMDGSAVYAEAEGVPTEDRGGGTGLVVYPHPTEEASVRVGSFEDTVTVQFRRTWETPVPQTSLNSAFTFQVGTPTAPWMLVTTVASGSSGGVDYSQWAVSSPPIVPSPPAPVPVSREVSPWWTAALELPPAGYRHSQVLYFAAWFGGTVQPLEFLGPGAVRWDFPRRDRQLMSYDMRECSRRRISLSVPSMPPFGKGQMVEMQRVDGKTAEALAEEDLQYQASAKYRGYLDTPPSWTLLEGLESKTEVPLVQWQRTR